MIDVILKRFDVPDETRLMQKGRFDWVVGDEPYVSLHFLGAERYAIPAHREGRDAAD